ncbi:MAG: bifunctional (p)ppGpp synthetase/guanosine-3',5'-bis(diphosphate) 3'-pyrophosphohydrolase, partial [Turneriella sp.]|nr:bifunctional (p)ppGpp synthetase/guanosine-3',5'-bis(diphosphate) 3'-pyrophosphohydrolase [Turneriella sp.]
ALPCEKLLHQKPASSGCPMQVPLLSRSSSRSNGEQSLATLLASLPSYTTRAQKALVKKAYLLAEDAHKFQKRLSGEPYIIHPLAVAHILAELGLDHEVICAGLLHDVLEDTAIKADYLRQEFGETISYLVESVTKISVLKTQSAESKQALNIRRMILATIRDSRVILIKLADKLHNMRTLGFHSIAKGMQIAREVLEIYAPLAGRLGIYKIKSELEDLALYHLDRTAYAYIKERVAEKKAQRDERVAMVMALLSRHLKEHKVKATVEGRSKHFYSIYHKMREQKKSFEEIYDLTGVRVLVDTVPECYTVLGLVHTLWTPVAGRFKDYISVPKSNGYQSLHTTVIGPGGQMVEVQIRTWQMHRVSEFGIASHWAYKEKAGTPKSFEIPRDLRDMADAGEETDSGEFYQELISNLSESNEVYVISPKGKIFTLPEHSTVLDFAFRVHTEIGLHCAGARIGDRLVSIRTQLKSGDQVEIITDPRVKPSLNWFNFLKTPHARAKLRAYFRRQQGVTTDRTEKSEEKKALLENRAARPVKPRVAPAAPLERKIEWQGETQFEVRFAQCCNPMPPDSIIGFVSRLGAVSVHKKGCPSLVELSVHPDQSERLVPLRWLGESTGRTATIEIRGIDRPQIYLDLVKQLAQSGANILEANATTSQVGTICDRFVIEIDSEEHLQNILKELLTVEGVQNAEEITA